MKKKITIFVVIFAIIFLTITVYYLSTTLDDVDDTKTIDKPTETHVSAPSNYCQITYKVSTNNGKTWHEAVINNGLKPLYKAECWKKYIKILDKFSASTIKDGQWESKNIKNKILANPAMKFSDEPFENPSKKAETKTNKDESKKSTPTSA